MCHRYSKIYLFFTHLYPSGSSDSESEDNIELNLHSDSENEWVEEEEDSGNDSNVDELKIDENNVSDSEMSM